MPEAPDQVQDQPTDEQAPEQSPDQAQEVDFDNLDTEATPPEGADPREFYEKRIADYQKGWTQKTQGLAEERREAQQLRDFYDALNDPDTQAEALRLIGLELGGEDENKDDEFTDPDDEIRQKLSELEEWKTEREQSEEQAHYEELELEFIGDGIQKLQDKAGREFTDEELKFLDGYSRANRLSNDAPDIDGAYAVLNGAIESGHKSYLASKRSPRPPGQGRSASPSVDLSTEKNRVAQMAEAAEAAQSSE